MLPHRPSRGSAYLAPRYAAPLEPRTELQVSKPALYLEAKRHLL
jgi:hypothetical protein